MIYKVKRFRTEFKRNDSKVSPGSTVGQCRRKSGLVPSQLPQWLTLSRTY